MNTKRSWMIVLSLICAMVLLGSALGAIQSQAAPLPAITPVSAPDTRASNAAGAYYPINFFQSVAVTEDGRGTTYTLANYSILDVQYTIDQGDTPNTVTLTLQDSNDGVNWVDQETVVSANAADASGMVQLPNFGRYANVYANVANTETVTITVIAVAK